MTKETDKNDAALLLPRARPAKNLPAPDRQEACRNRHDRCRPTRPSGDQGEGSLEVVLVMPVLILLITSVIQFALWSHATHVAVAAAQDGAETARLEGSSAEAGRARAEDFLAQVAPRLIVAPVVSATREAQVAAVVVRGSVASLVPGLRLAVEGRARWPVERFSEETEGP